MVDKLKVYKDKRSKDKTPEPFTSKDIDPKKLVFVIQKHRATALHWDFRLEVDGVMPSWAVPKGPSLDPSVRRLAMKTEDHPLDYRHFEGTIPEGEYGGGDVIIWDKGTYWAEKEIPNYKLQIPNSKARSIIKNKREGEKLMLEGIEKGEIKFFLNGKRLNGSFALVRTRGFPPGSTRDTWLLIKHKDEFVKVGYDAKDFETSIVSKSVLK